MLGTVIVFVFSFTVRNDHTTVTAPLPVCSAKLTLSGQVSTTVGDHVGIPGVVLLLIFALIADFRFQISAPPIPIVSLYNTLFAQTGWHGMAWHGGKAMTICTYFVSYYLLMRRGVAVPPLECWNN